MSRSSPAELERALERVADIHAQLARSAYFRGYRALPVAAMGVAALAFAAAQASFAPAADAQGHALSWLVLAVTCVTLVGLDMLRRKPRRRELLLALGQLVPALGVGLVVTVALWSHAELLPGLWALLFGLGVLASCPLLPRAFLMIVALYLAAGTVLLLTATPGATPSPWGMGLTFGLGHLLAGALLWHELEPGEQP